MGTARILFPALLAAVSIAVAGGVRADTPPADAPEISLLRAVDTLRAGDFNTGFDELQALVQRVPNFRLAQLLYGELLAARSGVADAVQPPDSDNPQLRELLAEYRARLRDAVHVPPSGSTPSNLLALSPRTHYAVIVDLRRSRLYLFGNRSDGVHLLRSYYASIARDGFGKKTSGDLRTPVGIYHVTSYTPGTKLPDLYGAGAFPVNYPNAWDRRHGRDGYGIWLHGVPSDTYARPPRTTEGCVVLANRDLMALKPYLHPGASTPVIFSDDLRWEPSASRTALAHTLERDIEGWRRSWSARDTRAYLGYYAKDFHTDDGMDRAAFVAYKARVNATKRFIRIGIRDLDLYRYPGSDGLVMAEFTRVYQSDDYRDTSRRQQFWKRQSDGRWKIVFAAGG